MNELDNKIEAELTPAKKTKKVELTPLEASIQARRNELNFPALQSMFELNEVELQTILDKLPPAEDCNC
jgi:hypothetical protein